MTADPTAQVAIPNHTADNRDRLPGESPCAFTRGADGWTVCDVHGWTGPASQRRRVLVCPNTNTPQRQPDPTPAIGRDIILRDIARLREGAVTPAPAPQPDREALAKAWREWTINLTNPDRETTGMLARDAFAAGWDSALASGILATGSAKAEPTADPTAREWLEHAWYGVQSLSDLYHGGGADGKGITVAEFRAGCDFIWQQIDAALAHTTPRAEAPALDVERLARALHAGPHHYRGGADDSLARSACTQFGWARSSCIARANAIAREYAALAPTTPEAAPPCTCPGGFDFAHVPPCAYAATPESRS